MEALEMLVESILYALIIFIAILLLEVFGYQGYLLNKRTLYAYLIDLKNQNPDLLVQTKCSLLKRDKVRILKAKIEENEIEIIVDETFVDDVMKVERAYYDKKHNKYYLEQKSKSWDTYAITPIEEIRYYKYKLKDRDFQFGKESENLFLNNEQVLFKNPFTGEYFWEKEINGRECITEVDLMTKTPKKLDMYFFNYKEMQKMLDYKPKTSSDLLGVFSLVAGIISLLTFFLKLFL